MKPTNTTEEIRNNPLLGLMTALPGGIEAQEAQGQRELVNSDVLPVDIGTRRDEDVKAKYKALGFVFGEPVRGDAIFQHATLPKGWKRQGSNHADAVRANLSGKQVELWCESRSLWVDVERPSWDFEFSRYRPKPETKTRPWNCAEDVPVGTCYIRSAYSDGLSWSLIVSAGTKAINVCGGDIHAVPYKSLESYRYSTDRREWHKCEVAE